MDLGSVARDFSKELKAQKAGDQKFKSKCAGQEDF